jgi:FkbM family methyltransferase
MPLLSRERVTDVLQRRYQVVKSVWEHPLNSGSKLRALYDYAIWNAVRFSLKSKFIVSLPGGLEIILGRSENYATSIYVHGLSDFEEMLFLIHLLREGDLFADVGANVGIYSILAAGLTRANVVALEPVPRTFAALSKNIRLNCLEALITSRQTAVGDDAGNVAMTSTEGGLDHIASGAESDASVTVPIARIDDIFAGHHPNVMKVDVEGFEMRALTGAQSVLADPALLAVIVELQDVTLKRYCASAKEVLALMHRQNFSSVAYDPFTRRLTSNPRPGRLNHLLVRVGNDAVRERLLSAPKIVLPGYPNGV